MNQAAEPPNDSQDTNAPVQNAGTGAPILPHNHPVEADDDDTKKLLDQFAGKYGKLDLVKEAEAARAAVAFDAPMKASNMDERLARLRKMDDRRDRLASVGVVATGSTTGSVSASPPVVSPPPVPVVETQAAAPAAPSVSAAAATPPRLIDLVGHLNRLRTRPPGWTVPSEDLAQRIVLSLVIQGATRDREDVLIPAQSAITIEARLPREAAVQIVEVRKIQFHPFALDRLLLGRLAIDDVTLASQGPLTSFARDGGAPTGLMTKESVLSIRVRNVTSGPAPFALSVVAVPLVPERR